MKQIYPDILDLVHEGKNVSGFVCVFNDEHLHSFFPSLFFFSHIKKQQQNSAGPKFKNWDLIQTIVLYEECETFDSFLMKFPEERAMVP